MKIKITDVEDMNLRKSDDLCKLAEMLGYGGFPMQLQCNNGAYVSSLLNFFDDNPGAMEAIQNWIIESNSFNLVDDYDDDSVSDEEIEKDGV